jgi:hypothetical protein
MDRFEQEPLPAASPRRLELPGLKAGEIA